MIMMMAGPPRLITISRTRGKVAERGGGWLGSHADDSSATILAGVRCLLLGVWECSRRQQLLWGLRILIGAPPCFSTG